MAISVPIGTEQYIMLKEISDKLGLSLKNTIGHVVSLHDKEMVKDSVEGLKEEKEDSPKIHDIEMTAPSLIYQQSSSTSQIQQHRNILASPPIRKEQPSTTVKYTIPPSRQISSNSSTRANHENILVENHQTIATPKAFTVPLYNPSTHGCPSCGASKNSDAKFCHNCGHSL